MANLYSLTIFCTVSIPLAEAAMDMERTDGERSNVAREWASSGRPAIVANGLSTPRIRALSPAATTATPTFGSAL